MPNKVTMQAVAKRAGVSVATVSRALRQPDLLKPETLKSIQTAIRELGYTYSIPVETKKIPDAVCVLLPTTLTVAFEDTLLGIQEATFRHSLTVSMGATNYDAATERALLERFVSQQPTGLILTGFSRSNEPLVMELADSGIPIVVIWEINNDRTISYIGFDNYRAFYNLTQYIVSLGHRRIGLVCGPYSKSERAQRRLSGYRAVLDEHGIKYDPSLVYEAIPSLSEGEAGFRKIMSRSRPPSAVLGGADMLALGALSAAQKMGLSVPGDVSIAGLDDIAFAAYSYPPLTTVRVPAYEIGEKAVDVIVDIWKQNGGVHHHCFETELMVRESCAPYINKNAPPGL
jgi:DNA-binding LacI/PurR family transcriptional regulator